MSESLTWVKSSYSSTGNCVEVASQPDRVLIRDTKEPGRAGTQHQRGSLAPIYRPGEALISRRSGLITLAGRAIYPYSPSWTELAASSSGMSAIRCQ